MKYMLEAIGRQTHQADSLQIIARMTWRVGEAYYRDSVSFLKLQDLVIKDGGVDKLQWALGDLPREVPIPG